jgi:hypothetical protein
LKDGKITVNFSGWGQNRRSGGTAATVRARRLG